MKEEIIKEVLRSEDCREGIKNLSEYPSPKDIIKDYIIRQLRKAIQKQEEEILKKIDNFEFAKRLQDYRYFGFDNTKINKSIKEELKKEIEGK